ncbi:MAG TPA: response regulator [Terriglobales bacterium]|nr:response regulator [Terriglobales bacterium]
MSLTKILIADDHESFRRSLRSFLESRGKVQVCEAADGEEAVEKAKELRPDLILLDVSMPRMNGLDAARVIRREVPESRVLIVSQNDGSVMERQAREVGACAFLTKGNLAHDLIPVIDRTVAARKSNGNGHSQSASNQFAINSLPNSEMAPLIQNLDWSKTPVGWPEAWSPALRMMVNFLLANRFPQLLWWGPQFCCVYNDAYIPVLGEKHPHALGQPVSEVWHEIWPILQPLIETPFNGGPATWMEDIELFVKRRGFVEETHFTIAYSPVPDETAASGIGGVLATVHEITEKVIGERRIGVLRELGAESVESKSAEEACANAARVLSRHKKDVPFALIYLLDSDGRSAHLAGATGVDAKDRALLIGLDQVDGPEEEVWPVKKTIETEAVQQVGDLHRKFRNVPESAWTDPTTSAAIVPLRSNIAHRLAGFMIAGVSPRLQFDESYRNFLELMSTQIATSIANARAYEEERKRAEALAEIDRAKTLFFSNVSHEFRTPLTLMLGPLEDALADSNELGSKQRDSLEVAHRNSLRLLKLVNTLLDFSRIEAGRIQACFEPTDLSTLTSELASVFRSATERAGLRFTVDCPPLSEPVYVDREMWEKIVFNLLSNAFKFTFAGEIEVSLRPMGGAVELSVRDSGTGIPVEEIPKLFERFHRVKGARGRSYEGSGIGLALVQELVRLHGGNVRVQSEIDNGSTFTVTLPFGKDHLPADRIGAERTVASTSMRGLAYVEEALRWLPDDPEVSDEVPMLLPTRSAASQNPSISGEKARILLADDNADMRNYVRRLLSDRYEVVAVEDGEVALQQARAHAPDLILTDVMMPRLDGFGLLREIRRDEILRSIPVVVLSARAGEESRVEGLDAGADDYLVKPFSARELIARVGSTLAVAKLRREVAQAAQDTELRFRDIIDALPVAIYTTDAQGRLTHFNSAAVEFSGRTPELGTDQWCVSWKLYDPNGTPMPHDQCPMAIALKEGRVVEGSEAIAERPDGMRRWFTPFPTPLRDRNGKVIGGINMLLDITQRKQAERTDSLLAAIVDSSDDAIVSKTLDGIITSWNKAAEGLFGYKAEEAVGRHITLIIPRERWSEEDMIVAKLRRGERIDHFETVRVRKDGSLLDLAVTISPVRDASGHVIGASKVARDIGERRRAERALADAVLKQKVLFRLANELHRATSLEDVYAAALSAICDAMHCDRASILLYDEAGVMRFVSWRGLSERYRNGVEGHLPWKREDLYPQPVCVENVAHADLDDRVRKIIKDEGIESLCFVPLVSRGRLIGKFMVYFPSPHVFSNDELTLSLTIARQLAFATERKRSEEALRNSEERFRKLSETLDAEVQARTRELENRNSDVLRQSEQLRELSWRLLRIQDDERRRIARELHDSAGQTLTALGMNVAQIAQKAQAVPSLDKNLQLAEELIQQLHQEIRTMSYLLHPPLLDETGLAPALTWYVEGLRSRSRLQMTLNISDDLGRLPSDMELVIFRVVQECLTNIHRHSGSKSAAITILRGPDSVTVEVCDKGKGMSAKKLAEIQSRGSGVGIRGMRERLSQLGGHMLIESDSSGTRVSATIPIRPEQAITQKRRTDSLPAAV